MTSFNFVPSEFLSTSALNILAALLFHFCTYVVLFLFCRATVNGKVISNSHSIVVDLTEKANGGIKNLDQIDFELGDDGADYECAETPFLRKSKMEEATAVFDAFIKKHKTHVETDSAKETLSSDR